MDTYEIYQVLDHALTHVARVEGCDENADEHAYQIILTAIQIPRALMRLGDLKECAPDELAG